jgi:hypothetical protein
MREERKVYKVLVGKPEGKRPLGRPRRRWEDGIRMDLREILLFLTKSKKTKYLHEHDSFLRYSAM